MFTECPSPAAFDQKEGIIQMQLPSTRFAACLVIETYAKPMAGTLGAELDHFKLTFCKWDAKKTGRRESKGRSKWPLGGEFTREVKSGICVAMANTT